MKLRALIVILAAFAAACNPSAPATQEGNTDAGNSAGQAQAPDPERDAMAAALATAAATDIGRPVKFVVTTKRTNGDWGWLVAQPWTPEGTQIDWSETSYAERAQAGALDGAGTTYALLRRRGGRWTVVEFAVGPTGADYVEWPQRHGAPASLIGE